MKISAFDAAMRGKRSITHLMTEAFLEGAREAGAEAVHVHLVSRKINRCRGCLHCWIKRPGHCLQKDDMPALMEQYLASDVVVMATPIYVDNVTGLMKDFMDRLIPITDPHFELDEQGECRHVKRYERYPRIVAISNSGYPEQAAFQVLSLLMHRIARNMNGELVGEIYRSGGGLLGLDQPMLAPLVDQYKALLRQAGQEVVKDGRLSAETTEKLQEPMVPQKLYLEQVNALWDRLIAKAAARDDKPGPN